MQRAPTLPGFEFGISDCRLFEREFLRERDDAEQFIPLAFEAVEIDMREARRGNLACVQQVTEFAHA